MKHINKIGKKIKVFREFRQISVSDLALRANLDVSQLEHIENAGNVPSLGHLIKISRALGVRLGTFLDDKEQIGPVVIKSGDEKAGGGNRLDSGIDAGYYPSASVYRLGVNITF